MVPWEGNASEGDEWAYLEVEWVVELLVHLVELELEDEEELPADRLAERPDKETEMEGVGTWLGSCGSGPLSFFCSS